MSEDFVKVERRDDGVAVIRLDRPKANALSVAVLRQLEVAARALTVDPPGAVVVWGGERIFAAGADINEFTGRAEAVAVIRQFRAAFDALAAVPRVTIAAVCGYALGGGCELALACDLRVVADTAKLGQPEILLGIIPGAGGTQRLTRLVGPSRAKDLVVTGRQVGAEEALRIGLADRVVPAGRGLRRRRWIWPPRSRRVRWSPRAWPSGPSTPVWTARWPTVSTSRPSCSATSSAPRTPGSGWRHFWPTARAGPASSAAEPPGAQAQATQSISAKVTRSGWAGTTRTAMP